VWWIAGLVESVGVVALTRLLVSQVRHLLEEVAGLTRTWGELRHAYRETGRTDHHESRRPSAMDTEDRRPGAIRRRAP
jgi:hypothetical protein